MSTITTTITITSTNLPRVASHPLLYTGHQFLRFRSSDDERGKPLMALLITSISDC
jgi:hypothetical protein